MLLAEPVEAVTPDVLPELTPLAWETLWPLDPLTPAERLEPLDWLIPWPTLMESALPQLLPALMPWLAELLDPWLELAPKLSPPPVEWPIWTAFFRSSASTTAKASAA